MRNSRETDYKGMAEELISLSKRHEFVKLSYIGTSLMGRPIPMITLGDDNARRSVLYVSTHHATENICTSVMMDFIDEYASLYSSGRSIYGINLKVLNKMRKIYIVPMLNPDGVEYRLNGIEKNNPLRDRVIGYNGGEDFTLWSSNARGVDLNHNYDAYFDEYKQLERERDIFPGKGRYSGECAESEPEVYSLANFIRYNASELMGILTFHTQGEEIYYKSRGKEAPHSSFLASVIGRLTGYCVSEAEGTASYGGLTDWFVKEFKKPSFTLECGKGVNPIDISSEGAIFYTVRELLYTFPILF